MSLPHREETCHCAKCEEVRRQRLISESEPDLIATSYQRETCTMTAFSVELIGRVWVVYYRIEYKMPWAMARKNLNGQMPLTAWNKACEGETDDRA